MIIIVQYHSLKRAHKLVNKNELGANLDRVGKSFRLGARFSLAAAFSGSTSKLSFPRLHFLRLYVEVHLSLVVRWKLNSLRLYGGSEQAGLYGGSELSEVELCQVVRWSKRSQVVCRSEFPQGCT